MIIVATILIAVYYLLLPKVIHYTAQNEFCIKCHEVQPYYETWKVSTHENVDCLVCHVQGTRGSPRQVLRQLEHSVWHLVPALRRKVDHPLKTVEVNCTRCHNPRRQVTPSGDLIIPHNRHIAALDGRCVDCHQDVVHAGTTRKQQGILLTTADINSEGHLFGDLKTKDFRPSMGTCMVCHDGKKAPYDCQRCHKWLSTPENHQPAKWKTEHGATARKNVAECVYCHAIATGRQVSEQEVRGLSLTEGVRFNDFCMNCHAKRPPSHEPNWSFNHRSPARNNREGCLTCHLSASGEAGATGQIVACNKCHQNGGVPSTGSASSEGDHQQGWLSRHPDAVKEKGSVDCFKCHGPGNCAACHTERAAALIKNN